MFTTKDKTKTIQTVSDQDKLTIDGDPTEYYVCGFSSFGHNGFCDVPLITRVPVIITPFASIATGVASYGTPYTVKAQVEYGPQFAFDAKRGPDAPKSSGYIVLKEAGRKSRSAFRVYFTDEYDGLKFKDQYVVKFISVVETKNLSGQVTARNDVTKNLNPETVEMTEGFETSDGIRLASGQAMIRLKRSEFNASEITGPKDYFTINVNGQGAIRYYLDQSIQAKIETSHHISLYLVRSKAST